MNLYLIFQEENDGYDTYSDAVVCAESEQEAQSIDPRGMDALLVDWSKVKDDPYCSWANNKESVSVKYLGVADKSIEKGVVCASFHAG